MGQAKRKASTKLPPPCPPAAGWLYVQRHAHQSVYTLFGVDFWEVAHALRFEFNLLLLQPDRTAESVNLIPSFFDYLHVEDVAKLDFVELACLPRLTWLDIASHRRMWSVTPGDVRELLYLRHAGRALNPAYLARLRRRLGSRCLYIGRQGEGRIELHGRPADFEGLLRGVLQTKFACLACGCRARLTRRHMAALRRQLVRGLALKLDVFPGEGRQTERWRLTGVTPPQPCRNRNAALMAIEDGHWQPNTVWLEGILPQRKTGAGA